MKEKNIETTNSPHLRVNNSSGFFLLISILLLIIVSLCYFNQETPDITITNKEKRAKNIIGKEQKLI